MSPQKNDDEKNDNNAVFDFDDPFEHFEAWFQDACTHEINDPNAMALATVDAQGQPSVRMVLLKHHDQQGFVFYTNLNSRKGEDLKLHPKAALCLYWKSLKRQIRIEGTVERVADDQADQYYHSRARESQIGAWASRQSQPLDCRDTLERRAQHFDEKFKEMDVIPRPDHWSGFIVRPHRIEFWAQRPHRLHDRFVYLKKTDGVWEKQRLNP